MTDDKQQIEHIRSLTLQQLVDLRANPKPSYSVDGQSVSWDDYVRSLQDTVDWCDVKLTSLGPFEIRSQGVAT